MRIKKSISKNGSVSLSVIKDVTSDSGKRTTKIVETLGNLDQIRRAHPGQDPFEWAKNYAQKLTQEEKKGEIRLIQKYDSTRLIDPDQQRSFNVGYLFLQSIISQLDLSTVFAKISDQHQFTYDLNQLVEMLIFARILYPSSKRSSYEQIGQLLLPEPLNFKSHHIYRALEILADESSAIQAYAYQQSKQLVHRNSKILYYDCTNYYFEIEEEDNLRTYGKSKENRPNPIVGMGLFMDGSGIPLAFEIFTGSKNEQPTLIPLEKQMMEDFNLSDFVVCTDAGLSSKNNRRFNSKCNRHFVTTQSIKKLNKELKEWALSPEGWYSPSPKVQTIDGLIDNFGRQHRFNIDEVNVEDNLSTTFYKEREIEDRDGFKQNIYVTWSLKYANYQRHIREQQINRALKRIDNPTRFKKKGPNDIARFIKEVDYTEDGEVASSKRLTLNTEQIREEEKYDGFYAVCTDLEADIEDIIRVNRNRWEIEESFRIMKSEFKARPVYLQREDRIRAHFLTCFLSLLVFRILEKKLNSQWPCEEIIKTMKGMNVTTLSNEGYIPAYSRTELTDRLHNSFGFRTDTEIIPQKKLKKIFRTVKKKNSTSK